MPELYRQMSALLSQIIQKFPSVRPEDLEVLLVDDGSRDASASLMVEIHKKDPRFKIVQLSRNFGHQIAITAGMEASIGDATVIMDADLQDPPEVVLEMLASWRSGNEIVYGVRTSRKGETWFKQKTAAAFYRLLVSLTDLKIPTDTGDFRLVDRRALDAFLALPERNRYVRGMMTWVGFKQAPVTFIRDERFAGETKYPFRKMVRLALNAMVSFSDRPLKIALNLGLAISLLSFLAGVWAVIAKLSGSYVVPGWTSLLVLVGFLGGVQLLVIGILGAYVGRIYDEVKGRPLYVVRRTYGLNTQSQPAARAVDTH